MNSDKFTAGLRHALRSASDVRDLPVFIELAEAPSVEQIAVLREAGVTSAVEGLDILTASLDRRGIELLSEQSWVMAMALSDRLDLLPADTAGAVHATEHADGSHVCMGG